LVISFGREKITLGILTVNIVLQGCYHGLASLFQLLQLEGRVNFFAGASESVGFDIYNDQKISYMNFELHVHIWGNGGPS
jgi:hypothetical protein